MEKILEYEKLVNKIAYQYSSFSNFEDLKQQGMIGLLKALVMLIFGLKEKF